jgi:predicted AAA+ superfamily ATPase
MIKREIFKQLEDHLEEKEITLIVGPRQAGKTTLMMLLLEELQKNSQKTLFLSLDNDQDKKYFNSQVDLVNFFKLNFGDQKGYVFIDEIQRKEDAGVFLKGIYDQNLPYKLIVTGSGSLELKEKIHESLAGRKKMFEVMTISLKEFVNFKTDYKFENNLEDFFRFDKTLPEQLLNEYMQYGGYPRVITSKTHNEKISSIQEIYTSYIEKDIIDLLNVQKSESFGNLLTILASQVGQIINYTELSSIVNIDVDTVKKYLWYLRKTFINTKVSPYFKNTRKEVIKAPVYYFNDLGLRNFALNRMSYFNLLTDGGFLFQNLIALQLKENYSNFLINYWRSKGGAEVDFILNAGTEILPMEVKYKELKTNNVSKSLGSYISEHKPSKVYVVNKNFYDSRVFEGTTVDFIPYYKLLSNNFIKNSQKSSK